MTEPRMTKKQFREEVMAPLSAEFGIPIYFNGEAPDGKTCGSFLGVAYTGQKIKPVCILWQRSFVETYNTLFHEVGHTQLHGKGSGCKKGKYYTEAEAESVSKAACSFLQIPYNPCFRNTNIKFIEYYLARYEASCEKYCKTPDDLRHDLINNVAQRIADVSMVLSNIYNFSD